MKRISTFLSFVIVAAFLVGTYPSASLATGESGASNSQNGNLCGGTSGIGQVASVENGAFTITRKDNGRMQVVRLDNQAAIKTSSGPIALSQLTTGENVTLVGRPNHDGSFAADTVVVCNGPQKFSTAQLEALRQIQTTNKNTAKRWNMLIDAAALILVSSIWFGTVIFLRLKKKQSFVYLLFFSIFYVYVVSVLDYTLFQFQSLILLKLFTPGLMLNGQTAAKSLNLIPLVTLRLDDVKTSLLNILLMIPFGFGLPFITNFRLRKVILLGMIFSISIECLQFIIGRVSGIAFRIADINDVIFNSLGATIGYFLFIWFIRYCRPRFGKWNIQSNAIARYIEDRPQVKS